MHTDGRPQRRKMRGVYRHVTSKTQILRICEKYSGKQYAASWEPKKTWKAWKSARAHAHKHTHTLSPPLPVSIDHAPLLYASRNARIETHAAVWDTRLRVWNAEIHISLHICSFLVYLSNSTIAAHVCFEWERELVEWERELVNKDK